MTKLFAALAIALLGTAAPALAAKTDCDTGFKSHMSQDVDLRRQDERL